MIQARDNVIIHADEIEPEAMAQIMQYANSGLADDIQIRVMPDVHAGKGCVIGFTSTLPEKIIPNIIGVDIGCGVMSVQLPVKADDIDLPAFDSFIQKEIPHGRGIHHKLDQFVMPDGWEDTVEATGQDKRYVNRSMCSLGGGNHFIEMGVDEQSDVWLTVHSGSRNFGLKVALHHQKVAKEVNPHGDLSYLTGDDALCYLNDMQVAQKFAQYNRQQMMNRMMKHLQVRSATVVESVHNYISEDNLVRKGAISAKAGEIVVIPWNMRDGLAIGRGKGNPDWNCSAPHGAGRLMSRTSAKKLLSMDKFQNDMEGVYTTSVNESTLDEAPDAYKDPAHVESFLKETVDIVLRMKPIYSFKSS